MWIEIIFPLIWMLGVTFYMDEMKFVSNFIMWKNKDDVQNRRRWFTYRFYFLERIHISNIYVQ